MIRWFASRTPKMDTIERWLTRAGLVIIFLLATSFIRFVVEYYQLRSPL